MNEELKLKIQACLDGELSQSEAARVKQSLNGDAGLLFNELKSVKDALAGNEPPQVLPESRDFFWSKIRREIERLEAKPELRPAASTWAWWKPSYVRSVARVAFVGCVAAMLLFLSLDQRGTAPYTLAEVETPSEEMGSITFRSEADGMTVVYLVDREGPAAADISSDSLIQ